MSSDLFRSPYAEGDVDDTGMRVRERDHGGGQSDPVPAPRGPRRSPSSGDRSRRGVLVVVPHALGGPVAGEQSRVADTHRHHAPARRRQAAAPSRGTPWRHRERQPPGRPWAHSRGHRRRCPGPSRPGRRTAPGRHRCAPPGPAGRVGPHHRTDRPRVLPQGRRTRPDHRNAAPGRRGRRAPVRRRTRRRRGRGAGHRTRTPLSPPAGRTRRRLPPAGPSPRHARQGRQLPGGHPGRARAPARQPGGRDAPHPAHPRDVHRPDPARRRPGGRGARGGGDVRPHGRPGEPGAPGTDLRTVRRHGGGGAHRLGTALPSHRGG